MSNITNKYLIILAFLIVFSPIFLSLDFSQGIKFDAWVGNLYIKPSVPISFLLLFFLSIINVKKLLDNQLIILILLMGVYMIINLYYGTPRAIIVGLGMLLPIFSFHVFKIYKFRYPQMFNVLLVIIVMKFIFDIYYIYFNGFTINLNYLSNIQHINFNTSAYIFSSIKIYSYYDYFTFIYYLAVVFSIVNITQRTMIYRSSVLLAISVLAVHSPNSRLFIYGIYSIPLLYIFYNFTKWKLEKYFYLFLTVSIFVTVAISTIEFNLHDSSLATRNYLAYQYFDSFKLKNIFFPFINTFRYETTGSLHNELLEIFSFFSFIIVYYYYLIMKIFVNVSKKYQVFSFFLIFIIIMGSLIQINLSNPYIGIMIGAVLAVLSEEGSRHAE